MSRISVTRSVGALTLAVALLTTACGGPTLPALTDPTEIVTAGLGSVETARSVHVELTASGTIEANLTGQGDGTSVRLDGTSGAADVDFANGKAHATFTAPGFLLSGELIQIGPTSYFKSNLSGPLFIAQEATEALPVDPTDPMGLLDDIGAVLTSEEVERVKGEDVDCGGKRCYSVVIELSSEQIAALAGPAIPSNLPLTVGPIGLSLTVLVERDTQKLAGITAVSNSEQMGSVTLTTTFSKWDEPVDITAPPADQVDAGRPG